MQFWAHDVAALTQLRQFQFRERKRLQYAHVEDNARTLPLLGEERKTHWTPVDKALRMSNYFASSEIRIIWTQAMESNGNTPSLETQATQDSTTLVHQASRDSLMRPSGTGQRQSFDSLSSPLVALFSSWQCAGFLCRCRCRRSPRTMVVRLVGGVLVVWRRIARYWIGRTPGDKPGGDPSPSTACRCLTPCRQLGFPTLTSCSTWSSVLTAHRTGPSSVIQSGYKLDDLDVGNGGGRRLSLRRDLLRYRKRFGYFELQRRKRILGGLKAYLRATDHTSSNIISRD
jgi:hypothetical protein